MKRRHIQYWSSDKEQKIVQYLLRFFYQNVYDIKNFSDLQLINFSDYEIKKISSKVVGNERQGLLETDLVDEVLKNYRSTDAVKRAIKV